MKKQKTSHGVLDIYDTLTPPSKSVAGRKVVITPTREIVVFTDSTSPVPPEIAIDIEFKNMDDFMSRGKNTVEAYHAEFLKVEPPKKQDVEQTAFMTWAWFAKHGKPILSNTNAEGEKVRASTIGDSQYRYGPNKEPSTIKTPQAKVCYDLFKRCIGERPMVLEKEMRAFVEAHAAELKTKQDPWRIFQYYRPTLIASNHIHRQ
jgi:hypothetical protein